MSSQSLGQYFNTIVTGAQAFLDDLPDEFLHTSSKSVYQLTNEINVYLRSGKLTKKEYDTVTCKTEQLIEEVEKLEIAYEDWIAQRDSDEFSDEFKSVFEDVMQEPTYAERRQTRMGWQMVGSKKLSAILWYPELVMILATIGRGVVAILIGDEAAWFYLIVCSIITVIMILARRTLVTGWILPILIIIVSMRIL